MGIFNGRRQTGVFSGRGWGGGVMVFNQETAVNALSCSHYMALLSWQHIFCIQMLKLLLPSNKWWFLLLGNSILISDLMVEMYFLGLITKTVLPSVEPFSSLQECVRLPQVLADDLFSNGGSPCPSSKVVGLCVFLRCCCGVILQQLYVLTTCMCLLATASLKQFSAKKAAFCLR